MRKKELKMFLWVFLIVLLSNFLILSLRSKNLKIISFIVENGIFIIFFVSTMLVNIIQKNKFYKMLKRIDFETCKAFYNDNQCVLFDLKKSKVAILYYSRNSNKSYPIYNVVSYKEIKELRFWEEEFKEGVLYLAFNFPLRNGVEDGVVFCEKHKKNSVHSEMTNNDLEFKSITSLYDYMVYLVNSSS